MKSKLLLGMIVAILLGYLYITFFSKPDLFPAQPPIPYLSPLEQAKTFDLPKGYRLELVLSDPVIQEPVAAAFDGNGRMFVAEMRSYMQDIDGRNQRTNTSCVSLHWSSKGDGNYDKHTIFADELLLPRMILPLDDALLVSESDSGDIWRYRDNNGDGVADEKTRVFKSDSDGGHIEHQESGLIWGLDNRIYITTRDYRLRLQGTNVIRENISQNGGQWGLSQDDYGKPWFVNASGDLGPLHFQQPFFYGRFTISNELAEGFQEVWPLVGLADVEGGSNRFRATDKTLNHLTAACGGEIYRGDRLPQDLRGDLLFAEPVGRLIRRSKIEVNEGATQLHNPYEKSEFIRSSDPNFRPVNMTTAPDGTLYIIDMYRGVIQEANWVQEGSYLRNVVQQYQLDKNVGRGRIWRLVHDDFKPGEQPRMQGANSADLVKHLDHPNGWWRDTAQKLLVLRNDKSIAPTLVDMARSHSNHLTRIHALWTLEGLTMLDPSLVQAKMKDEHPQVRVAAIRASETLFKKGDTSLQPLIAQLTADPDPNVVIQAMLTPHFLKWKEANEIIDAAMKGNPARGVQEIGAQLLIPDISMGREFSDAEKTVLRRGANIYGQLCFACHGSDGEGMPLHGAGEGATIAPRLARSKTVTGLSEIPIHILLKGLTGPVRGKTYSANMMPLESYDDEWIAAIASYIRNNFGNNASLIEARDVARARAAFKERNKLWTLDEIQEIVPQFLPDRDRWKVTASHGENTEHAIDNYRSTRFDTKTSQTPGMWFQIELPQETLISGLLLDAATSKRTYPREYKVELSQDGRNWGDPVATGKGSAATSETHFSPVKGKFLRITLTDATKDLWSIHEVQLLQPPIPGKVNARRAKEPQGESLE